MTHNTCAVVRRDQPFAVGEARQLSCSSDHTFKGRFVRITQHGSNLDMVLGEVEVDGTRGTCAIFVMDILICLEGSMHTHMTHSSFKPTIRMTLGQSVRLLIVFHVRIMLCVTSCKTSVFEYSNVTPPC